MEKRRINMETDYFRINEEALNKMLEAVERDRLYQADIMRSLRDELRQRARSFVPDKMADDFYRGMLSASLSFHLMLPETTSVEHAVVTIEEIMRVVLEQIAEERARRSMEAVADDRA